MYAKYERMREAGSSPPEVCSAGILDGLEMVENWKMLRVVFGLDFVHAKEAYILARHGESLAEHQGHLIPEVEEVLAQLNQQDVTSPEKLD